jgi:microsomal epoxide hydrolase
MPFDTIPSNATLKPKPFTAQASDEQLNSMKQLIELSPIGPITFENQVADAKDLKGFGITREWLLDAKKEWVGTT